MILKLFLLAATLLPLIFTLQWLNDRYSKDNEMFRKLVHIMHGVGLAALAFIVPLKVLFFVEALALVAMFVARYLSGHFTKVAWVKYLNKLYSVGRKSYGDFFFPISAMALVFIADSKWEFAAAILILGLADAAAALVGKRFGKSNSYKIFGLDKSLAGTVVFFIIAAAIVGGFAALSTSDVAEVGMLSVLFVAFLITISENIGAYGSDNLLIPLVAVVLLNHL